MEKDITEAKQQTPQTHGERRQSELLAFLFLVLVLAPATLTGLIASYGLLVWLLE